MGGHVERSYVASLILVFCRGLPSCGCHIIKYGLISVGDFFCQLIEFNENLSLCLKSNFIEISIHQL